MRDSDKIFFPEMASTVYMSADVDNALLLDVEENVSEEEDEVGESEGEEIVENAETSPRDSKTSFPVVSRGQFSRFKNNLDDVVYYLCMAHTVSIGALLSSSLNFLSQMRPDESLYHFVLFIFICISVWITARLHYVKYTSSNAKYGFFCFDMLNLAIMWTCTNYWDASFRIKHVLEILSLWSSFVWMIWFMYFECKSQ